jgi:ABC-type lipoprotein release transport system permease subunit
VISRLVVLVQIAVRNLLASPINLIIGGVIFAGTVLVVVGGAMLDSLDDSMSRSVIGSVSGHVQIYSSKSKDELSIFGQMGGGDPDLAAITEFPKIKAALESLPQVKTVVPMGTAGALVTSGNTVDLTLSKLRDLYKKRDAAKDEATKAELNKQIASSHQHVRQIVKVLESDAKKASVLLEEKAIDVDAQLALKRAISDEFWASFEADPYGSLEFLENKIAPQVVDSDLLFIRYVGTDLDSFKKSFDRLTIADGTLVPKGQRGMLLGKSFYEERLKLKNARRLDKMKDLLDADPKAQIKGDPVLERYVKENKSQTRDIVLQLDGIKTEEMTQRLRKILDVKEGELDALLSKFFDTDDSNFRVRYDQFYKELAPLLELYRLRVGDTLTIKAFTRSGYVQSVNVKVYGTYNFEGLEKSPLASGLSLMDLMSFRDLYGYLTTDKAEELKELQAASGVKAVSRETAEDDLFGGGREVVAEATPGVIDEAKELTGNARKLRNEDLTRRVYTDQELLSGVVLHAAIILKDPSKIEQTILDVERLSKEQNLNLKAMSWQKAAGLLGQFILVAKGALFFVVAIIFVIAMIIINNAMMMATLQRIQTIGTLRAIGAQRAFVLAMVLIETVALGMAFGAAGMVAGSGIMGWLHSRGIAAWNDYSYFFFSGPKLLPVLTAGNLIAALVIIILISTISTLTPAVLAMRVSPLRAMQSDE